MNETDVWIRVARCGDIPLREGRPVKIGNREIAVFNLGERFLAVENHCPHKGGPLADGIVSGTSVACPLHARKFSLETGEGASSASASSCVQAFPAKVEDGIVLLCFSKDSQNEKAAEEDLPQICIERSRVSAVTVVPLRT